VPVTGQLKMGATSPGLQHQRADRPQGRPGAGLK
jgi:hypothetical protein